MSRTKARNFGLKKKPAGQFCRGVLAAAIAALVCSGAVWAGSLTPPANPAASGYTLEDIYNRLNTNAAATAGNHSFSPSGSPAGSMYTLTQIYDKIPTIDASKILEDAAYLGVAGTIGIKDSIIGSNGELEISLPDGYYEGKTATAGDTDLIAANIKSGINIFGVDGNGNVVDTSGGTASAGDILAGKIAFSAGSQITGIVVNCAIEGGNGCYANSGYWTAAAGGNVSGGAGLLTFDIPNGYYSGKTATAGDMDLIAANIKAGVSIFGIDGNSNVMDTSTGTASAGDILSGKKAWVEGMEITGTYSPAGYIWTKAGAGSWEGVNENLD